MFLSVFAVSSVVILRHESKQIDLKGALKKLDPVVLFSVVTLLKEHARERKCFKYDMIASYVTCIVVVAYLQLPSDVQSGIIYFSQVGLISQKTRNYSLRMKNVFLNFRLFTLHREISQCFNANQCK